MPADTIQIPDPATRHDNAAPPKTTEPRSWEPAPGLEAVVAYLVLFAVMISTVIAAVMLGFLP